MKVIRVVMTFFRSSLAEVAACAQGVLLDKGIPAEWTPAELSAYVATLLDQLPPLDAPPAALLFTSPACASWTGFMSRQADGWITMVSSMSKRAPQIEAISIGRDLGAAIYPSTSLEFFSGGASVRRVRAWREDDGWHFVNRGEVLPFEVSSNYKRRAVKDRLNGEVVDDVLLKLGIDFDELFNQPMSAARLLTT